MTLTIPAWALWLAFALWPWPFVVLSAWLTPSGRGMFDFDILTPFLAFGAFMWTAAVVAQGVASWLMR